MTPPPFFSIIIPTYNRSAMLKRALSSILGQSFGSWEVLVIDDGSIDDTKDVVSRTLDQRIKYIYQEHSERSAARNRGLQNATGTYVTFLDDDDYYLPNHLEGFADFIKPSNLRPAVFFCGYTEDRNGELCEVKFNPRPSNNGVEFFLLNLVNVPRVCILRQAIGDTKFNNSISIGEDRDFLAELAVRLPVVYAPLTTQVLVVHPKRSVDLSNEPAYIENIHTCQHLIQRFGSFLSTSARKTVIAQSFYNMSLASLRQKKIMNAFYWAIKALIIKPGLFKRMHAEILLRKLSLYFVNNKLSEFREHLNLKKRMS